MALLDLLGRRWALRVIWELRPGPLNFRELQGRCEGMSSSVLNARLGELREAGIVERAGEGYRLSDEGRLLMKAYPPLGAWAERWARRSGAAPGRHRGERASAPKPRSKRAPRRGTRNGNDSVE